MSLPTRQVRGHDYYQSPAPFSLPDEVDVGGVKFTGCRARAYWLLRLSRERQHRHAVGTQLGPPGKVPVYLLKEPWSGGSSGDRRVRELKRYGCRLEISDFDAGASATTLYELVFDPLATPIHGPTPLASGPAAVKLQSTLASMRDKGYSVSVSLGGAPRSDDSKPLAGKRFRLSAEHSDVDGTVQLSVGGPPPSPSERATTASFYLLELRADLLALVRAFDGVELRAFTMLGPSQQYDCFEPLRSVLLELGAEEVVS